MSVKIFLALDKDEIYKNNSAKMILFYTPFFESSDYYFGFGNKPFIENECPVTNCITTNNKNSLSMIFLLCMGLHPLWW